MTPYYADEWVSIYHGDAWEIAPQLSGISAVVTSPPYNQMEDLPETGSGLGEWGFDAQGGG